MILVDSAVWADWFNGAPGPYVERLEHAFAATEDVALAPIILTEVLQGFRSNADFERARRVLVRLPMLLLDENGHVEAARLFRVLRRKGMTVRGAIDCVIAQTSIEAGAELLSPDRDFAAIARHSRLRLCAV